MPEKRLLVSWIGYNDLLAMAMELPGPRQKKVSDMIKRDLPTQKQAGPIRTLVDKVAFDEVHLLSNFEPWADKEFTRWLGHDAKIHKVEFSSPIDYPGG